MKYGICNWILPTNIECPFEYASKAGFDGVAVEIRYDNEILNIGNDEFRFNIIDKVKKHELEIPSFALNFLCDIEMTHEKNHRKINELIKKCIDFAYEMKVEIIQIPSFFESYIRTNEDFDSTAMVLKTACEYAELKGVGIGWENALDVRENTRMVEIVDSSVFSIYFDTLNPVTMAGLNNVQLAKDQKNYVIQMHAKDCREDKNKPLFLGEGISNFDKVAEVLKSSPYLKWVILESEYKEFKEYKKIIQFDLDKIKKIFD